MGLGLFMSQVNWTQLTEAMVLIRSSAFSGSSWAPEEGHLLLCLATPWNSASQQDKVPLCPMQHLQGQGIILSLCNTSRCLSSGAEEAQHKMWEVQTCPFGLAGAELSACATSVPGLPQ